jgi:hypothetical protein
MHLLTTIAMLKGLEESKIIKSTDEVIRARMHPTDPRLPPFSIEDYELQRDPGESDAEYEARRALFQ